MSTESNPIADYAQAYGRTVRWAAQPEPPPEEKLKEYAVRLAPIYADILTAFQESGPPRTQGESVAFGTVEKHLLNEGKGYTDAQLGAAFDKLVGQKILTESGARMWYAPTKLGEALIGVITGRSAVPVAVPDLPAPTW